MSYKVSYGRVVIEVNTERELRDVMEILSIIEEPRAQIPLVMDATGNGAAENGANPFRLMYRRAKAPQRRLLDALVSVDWIQDKELCQRIGIQNNLQLAGMWLGVVKNAKRFGLQTDQVFRKEHRKKGADAGYWYQMTNKAKEGLRQP